MRFMSRRLLMQTPATCSDALHSSGAPRFALPVWLCHVTLLLLSVAASPGSSAPSGVRLWETNQVIPTYRVAPADPNPRFYQGRTYQGARATFYPYPVMDKLTDLREDKTYKAVFLENEYVQLSVLPELGGRIFSALDKGDNYDFFYRQHVIKPALIGMLGAWISGGVEWNVPHHHRATSFMPVDYTLQENEDGSKTIWLGETELRHRMKWLVGLALYPDRSYIEMTMKVSNPTPFAHSLLFWINPAVHANENYQVIFPPDAEFAVQHGKPEFAHWPLAREFYGGTDYTRGVDISWWKSHPSPVSFFCFHSDEDFFGGYDHGKQAGVLHVADHHVVPGKKFFEWGVGPEGGMWSQILTDNDGPYLELMAGAYSDNQPDYSWVQPGEVKTWKHYWYPVRQLGAAKKANLDAAVNLEVTNRVARIAFNTTTEFPDAQARLEVGDKALFDKTITISPDKPFATEVLLENAIKPDSLRVALLTADGRELIAYQPVKPKDSPMPKPVQRPLPPKDVKTTEELYLTGLRLEQLYSPSFEAAPYYEEAIRRDPGDYRANTALGILLCKQWRWTEAEARLNAAIERATANYIRPKDGEAFYYLGIALKAQGKVEAAYDALYQAVWSRAWQAAGYYELAELDCARGNWAQALELINHALAAGAADTKALNLQAAILRRARQLGEAEETVANALDLDPLDFRTLNEFYLLQRDKEETELAGQTLNHLRQLTRGEVQSFLELAADYGNAGLWPEASDLLERYLDDTRDKSRLYPMVYYCLGFYADKAGRAADATKFYQLAAQMPPDYCFPLRFEDEPILRRAMEENPKDARAPYYLGNLLYDNQPAKAITAWEKARELDAAFAMVHRNLGLAYAQAEKNAAKAVASLDKAIQLNPKDPRWFYELDVQSEAAGTPVLQRLETLTRHHEVVAQRDDALTREIVLLTVAGQHDRALELLTQHHFHNWEGSGEIHGICADALLQRGQARLRARQFAEALQDFAAASEYPTNLEVGRARRDRKAEQVAYFIATAHEGLGDQAQAKTFYEKAVERKESGASEVQFCQALALQKLGRDDDAKRVFEGLIKAGQDQSQAGEQADYFAKFGERQSERVRKAQAHYLTGLGYLGLGRQTEAQAEFKQALELNPSHLGANQQAALKAK
jgi:tetratricopeptide (TPR) repeat protein